MGYLGKISALVTANTGDFSRNLNAAASDVRKFATSVQNNITKASSDAERAFKSIYTPLQTLERSLAAAASMKLSFKGFDGAIRDINVLKERLTSIKGTQVDLILKASGLKTITEFREAIKDISNESFNFAVRFGGIDKLKLIREELRSVSSTSINAVLSAGGLERLRELKETVAGLKGGQLNLALRVGGSEALTKVEQQATGLTRKDMSLLVKVGGAEALDKIVEEVSAVDKRTIDALVNIKGLNEFDAVLESFRTLAPEQIDAVIKVVGARDLEDAVTRVQQLKSAAMLVAEPLAAAAQKFSKLSVDAQAGFVAALNVSQTKVRELQQDINDGVTVGTTRFKQLEAQVLRTAEAIDRLGEAEALVNQVGNGRSFQFERPLDREALMAASESRNAALKLPGQALADNPEIASLQNRINGLANQYPRLQSNLEAAKEAGADYSPQIAAIEKWRAHLLRLIADQQKQIEVSSSQGQATQLPRFRGESSFIGDRIAAQRAAQEEAMFADRASETAAARATAERQRRLQRQTFGDAVIESTPQQATRLFGGDRTQTQSLETALARTAELDAAYSRLSETARASLRPQADVLDGIARAASAGAASVGVLADANNRMAASIAAVTAATERDAAAERARQSLRMRSIAEDDRRITQERAIAEERRRTADEFAASRRSAVSGAAGILASRVSRQDSMETVLAGLTGRAQQAQTAVASASSTGDYEDLRQRLTSVLAELQAVESEERRLAAIDPAREQIESWVALDNAIRNAYDRLGAITGMAGRARQAAQDAGEAVVQPDMAPPAGVTGFLDVGYVQARAVDEAQRQRARREAEIAVPIETLRASAETFTGPRMGDATGEFGPQLPPGFGGASDAGLGIDVEDPRRRLATLISSTAALKSQIAELSPPIRVEMVAAIRAAEQEMLRLAANSDTTGDQIEQAATNLRNLEATARRLSAVDAFSRSFGNMDEFLSGARVRQFSGEMTAIRDILSSADDSPERRRAAAAARRLAGVRRQQLDLDEAERGGAVFPEERAALNRRAETLGAVVDRNAAAAAGIPVNQARRRRMRGGDVGRMGADNASLALNQLAFAVDDFMSSTGGIEFKLRAISNNITQMGFVLGGTTGLFVGLGATIGASVGIMLMKWVNGGRSAEDQTKALNDALARQKSLVEELAQAFSSLGDDIVRGAFSQGAEEARAFQKQIEAIEKKQKELREGRVADLDPNVQRERAEQSRLQRELEGSDDAGQRVALVRQLQESRDRERQAAATAAAAPPPSREDMLRSALATVRANEFLVGGSMTARSEQEAEARRERLARDLENAGNAVEQDRVIRERLAERQEVAARPITGASLLSGEATEIARAREDVLVLARILESLGLPVQRAVDKFANEVAQSARGPAESLRQAQDDVADAIRRGVPSAAAFQRDLDELATKLSSATKGLSDAQKDLSGDPQARQQAIEAARKQVAEVEAQQAAVQARAREVRLGRTVGGERATSALSRIEGDERFKNELAGITASLRAAVDAETAALGQLEAARRKGNEAEQQAAEQKLEVARRASEVAAALAETALAIEGAVSRVRKIGENALQQSEQAADAAQRGFEQNPVRGGAREARDFAEGRLINDRAEVARAQAALDQRRATIQQDPRMLAVNGELEAITQRRKDLEAKANLGGLNNAERDELASATAREIELIRQREQLARQLTEAERRQLDAINNRLAAEARAAEVANRRNEQADPIARRQREAGQIAEGADREAENAQQRFLQNPTVDNARLRAETESRARQERARGQEIEDRLETRRREIEGSQPVQAIDRRIAANDARLQELAGIAATRDLTGREIAERDALQAANRQRRADRDGIVDAGLADARADIDRAMIEQGQRERALRGRDLGMTEQERNRKEIAEGVGGDINARADEMRGAGEDPAAFLRQALANQMEQMAPALYQLQQNRENAMLQGPSRAALKVNDVSTSAGAAELTRLLRGDDPAKDVNLAELRKQTAKFDTLIEVLKQQNPGVLL
jgi:antitoxin component of RelBE/YafQ-DinJ toxin-antitoxin module